ncbi:hypothetical protein B566_EDAN002592 [Ephemera danica]|nr:hypothetical protein B566_EDAN002592 [Ephemera danica]
MAEVLSLAGDALCLAATALRLTLLPASTPGHNVHLREVSLKEVANHDSLDDSWIVIHDLVYDISKFMHKTRRGKVPNGEKKVCKTILEVWTSCWNTPDVTPPSPSAAFMTTLHSNISSSTSWVVFLLTSVCTVRAKIKNDFQIDACTPLLFAINV